MAIDIFLLPGEYFVGDARHCVRTLLGSCVSVTLWQPQRRIGAMSHFLMPGSRADLSQPLNGRYAEDALELMFIGLRNLGVNAEECQAKLFGGAAMFAPHLHSADIGRKNGEAAQCLLAARGVRIVSRSLFDGGHRRISFDIASGEVEVQLGPSPHATQNHKALT